MSVEVRPFAGLGKARFGWLNASHHFSFGQYHDAARMGVGPLRVWNDDEIAARTGFDPHPHRDMEIITYVRQGAITHQDSLGNEGRTEAGDVQVMSAGTGIRHAEHNRLLALLVSPMLIRGTVSYHFLAGVKELQRRRLAGDPERMPLPI